MPLAESRSFAGSSGCWEATCQLDLESEHDEWFPGQLRHILDNLMSNALKNRDPDKVETWVRLGLKVSPEGYEFRLTNNGTGLGSAECDRAFDLFYRAAPARAGGLGVGLAVVKLLVEQSGGHPGSRLIGGNGDALRPEKRGI